MINHNKNAKTFLYELTLELTDIGNGACTWSSCPKLEINDDIGHFPAILHVRANMVSSSVLVYFRVEIISYMFDFGFLFLDAGL